jgi:hypothetical protein
MQTIDTKNLVKLKLNKWKVVKSILLNGFCQQDKYETSDLSDASSFMHCWLRCDRRMKLIDCSKESESTVRMAKEGGKSWLLTLVEARAERMATKTLNRMSPITVLGEGDCEIIS